MLLVVLFCATMLGLNIGCSNKKVEPADSTNVDTTSVDTVQKVDTVAQIIEETPMPKAADLLFEDFFFNFIANRYLQRKRI